MAVIQELETRAGSRIDHEIERRKCPGRLSPCAVASQTLHAGGAISFDYSGEKADFRLNCGLAANSAGPEIAGIAGGRRATGDTLCPGRLPAWDVMRAAVATFCEEPLRREP